MKSASSMKVPGELPLLGKPIFDASFVNVANMTKRSDTPETPEKREEDHHRRERRLQFHRMFPDGIDQV